MTQQMPLASPAIEQPHSLLWKAEQIRSSTRAGQRGRLRHNVLAAYLIRELLLYFIVAFLFMFLLFFVNQILLMVRDVVKNGAPMMDVLRLIAYSLPMVIAQSAPSATIVGFLMCLGRLVTDNEILIFRASGKSYGMFLGIVLVLGIGISLISFGVNDYLLPVGNFSYRNLRRTILSANPAVELESNSVKRTNDSTIVIGTVEGKKVSDLLFFGVDAERNPRIIISGVADVSTPDDESVMLQLNMSDVLIFSSAVDKTGDYDVLTSDKVNMNVFTSDIAPVPPLRSATDYTSRGLWEEIKDMQEQETVNTRSLKMYILELHRKFSQPFASIFFAFLALPLAIVFGKQNGQTIGLIIGLFLSFVFWAMIIVGQKLSIENGFNPAVTMWAPDALMLTLAVIFFFRLKKQ